MLFHDLFENIGYLSSTVKENTEISGIAYDSRAVQPGNLFVAVSGFQADGHRYIPMAAEKGAAAVVCEHAPEIDIPYILVESSRKALAQLSAAWFGYPSRSMAMVGITGTNGKTSSTVILKQVLEQTLSAKVGLIGTIQNMIGQRVIETERTTPESYELQKLLAQMRDEGCTHVIMEVSSHALCLSRVEGIHFRVGAFTNLTEDHLDFHGTMEAYRQAKSKLFSMCDTGVFNMDDPAAEKMIAEASCRIIRTSKNNKTADIRAESAKLNSDSVEMTVSGQNRSVDLKIGIPGLFTVYNVLTVLGCASALGVPLKDVASALTDVKGVKGRIEVVPVPGCDYTVLIDYAHTPDALENILKSVRAFCKGRLIALFGCGGDRDPIKRPIMGRIAMELADFVVFTSDNPRTEDSNQIIRDILVGTDGLSTPYYVEEDRRKAIRWAMDHAEKDDIIVLAGKGHETYQERNHIKYHLDEREEVAAHLQELGVAK